MPTIKFLDKHFVNREVMQKITVFQWINLKLSGNVFVFYAKKAGWSDRLPFYVVHCSTCKEYFLDYLHGYHEYFICPRCKR